MKILYKFRIVTLMFGIVLAVASFFYNAVISLPILDSTTELLKEQMIQLRISEILFYVGIFLIIASLVFLIYSKYLKK